MRLFAPLVFAVAFAAQVQAEAAPRVVASVPPVHGLVAAVMEGAGEPALLISGDVSPHDFALRPSDAQALAEADVIFMVGAGLEGALEKAIDSLAESAEVTELGELPGLDPLPAGMAHGDHAHGAAEGAAGPRHGHEHGHEHAHEEDHAAIDPHLWLDPAVAALWLDHIAAVLANADPENAALYRANAAEAAVEIAEIAREIDATLEPVRGRDYAVYHDAYRYFERRFGLAPGASLASTDADAPGPRSLAELRERLGQMEDPCLFAEPQHDAALVRSLARDSGARMGLLDPIGREIPAGPEFYPALLRSLAEGFVSCLGADS